MAQSLPTVAGTATGGTTTTTTTTTATNTSTSGDSTVTPFQNTTTTVQNQTVASSTTGDTAAGNVTFAGTVIPYTITASGTGSFTQTSTTSLLNTYNPGPPPTLASSVPSGPTIGNISASTITAVSASSAVNTNSSGYVAYAANLSTSGTPVAGSVTATENVYGVTTSGLSYATYVGTATYNPANGNVVVALPSTPTSLTSLTSAGLSTTGNVSAAGNVSAGSIVLNGSTGRITGVTAGTATTDAVNVGQLNTAIAGVNTTLSALTSSVGSLSSLVDSNRKRSDAGIATAVALSGGMFLPDKRINLTANVGAFRDEVAVAAQLGVLVSENVALNAGVATSLHSYGGTAVRGGVTFGF